MTPNQRITIVVTALSSVAFAGAVFVLASNEPAVGPLKKELRPSVSPDRTVAPTATTADTASRFAYVPLNIGELMLPPEGAVLPEQSDPVEPAAVAADPGTWSVDINKRPAATPDDNTPAVTRPRAPPPRRAEAPGKRRSLRERLKQISPRAMPRVAAKFEAAKVAWPPDAIVLLAIKDKKALELYARSGTDRWSFVHRYRVLAASGARGPKLRRGDRQVPEGFYRISYLNPNSRYHVSLRINYPNRFDRRMAAKEGRRDLGGDIMIHGKNSSAGCLAMGDEVAEELFVLAAEVGLQKIKVIIAPTDLRETNLPLDRDAPDWLPLLYTQLAGAMSEFKAPPKPTLWSLLGLGAR